MSASATEMFTRTGKLDEIPVPLRKTMSSPSPTSEPEDPGPSKRRTGHVTIPLGEDDDTNSDDHSAYSSGDGSSVIAARRKAASRPSSQQHRRKVRIFRGGQSEDTKRSSRDDLWHSDLESVSVDASGSERSSSKTTSAILLADEEEDIRLSQGIDSRVVITNTIPRLRSRKEIESYEKMIYMPSSKSVVDGDLTSIPIWNAEEEGIYTGESSKISLANKNLLERRLLTEGLLEKWLGPEGNQTTLPNPYRTESIQMIRDEGKEFEYRNKIAFVPAKRRSFMEFPIMGTKEGYEIIVDIGFLNFLHHPLFSVEHVLASRVEMSFREYSTRLELKTAERASNKLEALRTAIAHVKAAYSSTKQSMVEAENDPSTTVESLEATRQSLFQFRNRVRQYRKDMQKMRLERDQSLWDDKTSLISVLDAWKDLRTIRQQQGYTNTILRLNINTVDNKDSDRDRDREKAIWKREMEAELADLRGEHEENFEVEMMRYKKRKMKWDAWKKRTKAHKKENQIRDDGDSETSMTVPSSLNKPVPPPKFDEEATWESIEKRYREVRSLPGEPKIGLELLKTTPVTAKGQLPQGVAPEHQRRKAVHETKFVIVLRFNKQEVFRSKAKEVGSDFCCFVGYSVPVPVKEWPQLLDIQILDIGHLRSKILATIALKIPNGKTSIERSTMQKLEFVSKEKVKSSSSACVGSGIPFEIFGTETEGIHTKGNVTVRLGWSTNREGKILCPKGLDRYDDEESHISRTAHTDQLDPNDPMNAFLMHLKHRSGHSEIHGAAGDEKFMEAEDTGVPAQTLDSKALDEGQFCSLDWIDKSPRVGLIRLREEGVPEFKNLKMIPLSDKDISPSLLEAYEKRLQLEEDKRRTGEEHPIAVTRRSKHGGSGFIEEDHERNRLDKIRDMRMGILEKFAQKAEKQITLEDVVYEEQMPNLGTLGWNLMTLFQPKRPLRPTRKERKHVVGSSFLDSKMSLIVNIVRAFNLPMRKDTWEVGLLTTESLTGVSVIKKRVGGLTGTGSYATVKPFVEVWFQRNVNRTTTAIGSNPTWNQELFLNIAVPNQDFSIANLNRMDDLIYLLLYDEVAIDLLEDDRRRHTDIHQRLEKRWLGTISIPFSTLLRNGRIEGTFKVNSPAIMLGYEAQNMATHFGQFGHNLGQLGSRSLTSTTRQSNLGQQLPLTNQTSAYVTLFATLQPCVLPSSVSKGEDGITTEASDLISHVKSWKNGFESKFPERIIRPFVITGEGNTILCTRFLTEILPPDNMVDDSDLMKTMCDLSHFVSLFPSIRDWTLGPSDYSLWFNSDTFVSNPGGGKEDHAVLLACYFLYLNVPCWILQGNAIPDGQTLFVLTSFKGINDQERRIHCNKLRNAVLIWNPCTGEYFGVNDNFCPLQHVWAAVGKVNIWANTDENDRPHQLDWDIGKSKSWLPLFSKSVDPEKLTTIQNATIRYKMLDQTQANSLAQRIERQLKDVFMKIRKSSKTNWNRYCSATLRRLLPRLEEWKRTNRAKAHLKTEGGLMDTSSSGSTVQSSSVTSINEEHLVELRELMRSYELMGFPLQQTYVNLESLVDSVHATGLHTIDSPDVEFAIAAYAHAYPSSLYSVWIYLAALHRRK